MIYRIILLALLLTTAGCASGGSLQRTEILESDPRWKNLDVVQSTFEKIIPGVTRANNLNELGFGGSERNVRWLSDLSLRKHFLQESNYEAGDNDTIPKEVIKCLKQGVKCYGLVISIEHLQTIGKESFSSRIIKRKRIDEITGWKFSATIVILEDTIVYAKINDVTEKIYAIKEKKDPLKIFEELMIPLIIILSPIR